MKRKLDFSSRSSTPCEKQDEYSDDETGIVNPMKTNSPSSENEGETPSSFSHTRQRSAHGRKLKSKMSSCFTSDTRLNNLHNETPSESDIDGSARYGSKCNTNESMENSLYSRGREKGSRRFDSKPRSTNNTSACRNNGTCSATNASNRMSGAKTKTKSRTTKNSDEVNGMIGMDENVQERLQFDSDQENMSNRANDENSQLQSNEMKGNEESENETKNELSGDDNDSNLSDPSFEKKRQVRYIGMPARLAYRKCAIGNVSQSGIAFAQTRAKLERKGKAQEYEKKMKILNRRQCQRHSKKKQQYYEKNVLSAHATGASYQIEKACKMQLRREKCKKSNQGISGTSETFQKHASKGEKCKSNARYMQQGRRMEMYIENLNKHRC